MKFSTKFVIDISVCDISADEPFLTSKFEFEKGRGVQLRGVRVRIRESNRFSVQTQWQKNKRMTWFTRVHPQIAEIHSHTSKSQTKHAVSLSSVDGFHWPHNRYANYSFCLCCCLCIHHSQTQSARQSERQTVFRDRPTERSRGMGANVV